MVARWSGGGKEKWVFVMSAFSGVDRQACVVWCGWVGLQGLNFISIRIVAKRRRSNMFIKLLKLS